MTPPKILWTATIVIGAVGCVDAEGELPEIGDVAQEITAGDYRLVRRGAGKCLDVAAGGTANGTVVQQWSCVAGSPNQTFRLEVQSGDDVRLVHIASGKCVTAAGGGTSNGTAMQLYTCNGSGGQTFRVQSTGGGFDRLRNPASNKCLDVNGNSSGDGAKVQLWTCNSSDAQRWRFEGASGGGGNPGLTRWRNAVVTAYTFQDNSACNSTMTSSGRPLIPYVSVALPSRFIRPYGSGPFNLGDRIFVSFLKDRVMPNGQRHTGWVQIDDFCGDGGDDAYCFQNGQPNVDLYIGDWAASGMSCLAANPNNWGTGSFSGPGGDSQEDTDVFFGPPPAGAFVGNYGGRAKGSGRCGVCSDGMNVQPRACWHYNPGTINAEYCNCSNSNGRNNECR